MVKLSIALPNSTQITLESDEPDVINQVLGLLLHRLSSDAAESGAPTAIVSNGHSNNGEKSTDATPELPASTPPPVTPPPATPQPSVAPPIETTNSLPQQAVPQPPPPASVNNGASTAPLLPDNEPDDGLLLELQTQESREDFTNFCQTVNPMGDMRRVVVAAEGAARFFQADGVNAEELGELFDLAGWRRANSFTQTLRNAARSKFGWLERVPGRAGCYAPTELGRSVTLSATGS